MEKSISKNFIFNFIKTLLNLLFPLITFPFASRVLGVDNLGKVQYCNSIISYFSLIASLGISLYAVRQGSKYRDNKSELSKFSKEILIINSCSLLLAYSLFIMYLLFFFYKPYYMLIVICSFTMFFSTFAIDWLYQIKEDYAYITMRSFAIQLFSLILLILLVKTENDYVIYAFISIIGSSGSFIFNIWNARKYIEIRKVNSIELKKHIKPIFTIFGISIASSIYLNLDTVMLGSMVNTVAVGLYSSASKVSQIVKMLITAFSNVLFPRLSNYVARNKLKEYKKLFYISIKLILCLSIPAAMGMVMLSKEIIILFSGEAYVQASLAAKILSINIIFSIIDGALYYQVLLPFGKEKFASFGTAIGAFVNLILNFFMIPIFSFHGAAFTTLLSEMCVFIMLYYYANKILNLKCILIGMIRYVLYSIPIVLLCFVFRMFLSNISLIISSVFGGILLYAMILIMFHDPVVNDFKKMFFHHAKIDSL